MEDPVGLPQSAVPKHRPEKNHRDRPAAPLGLLPRAPATGVPLVPSLVSLPPILLISPPEVLFPVRDF